MSGELIEDHRDGFGTTAAGGDGDQCRYLDAMQLGQHVEVRQPGGCSLQVGVREGCGLRAGQVVAQPGPEPFHDAGDVVRAAVERGCTIRS
jgi:hypothetical protein